MRIVHVINYFQHQLGYQEYFLSKEHAKAGHEVTVITSNKYVPFPDYEKTAKPILGERIFEPREEQIDGFRVIRLRGVLEQPARRIMLIGLFRKIREVKPDIVICHGEYTYNTLQLALIRRIINFKLIIDCHALYTESSGGKNGFLSKPVQAIFRKFVWSDRKIVWVAVQRDSKEFMINEYGFDEKNIAEILHGSDINRFKPDLHSREKIRRDLNVEKNNILIVYTGKLVYSKDPALIMEACNGFCDQYKLKLLFVGHLGDSYAKRFNSIKNKIKSHVIHVGAVPNSEIHKYYQAADIAVWPKEASMSSVDAMSCGLPIIVSDYLPERLKNDNGIGIREANVQDLRIAIEKLASNKALREEMGRRGRELVAREMSWEKVAKRFIDIAFQTG